VLPRGILRESIRNLSKADFIFLTKSNGHGSDELCQRIRALNPRAEIIECRHRARYVQNAFTAQQQPLEALQGLKAVVISGIAAPEGFEAELRRRGVNILETYRFADHHRYTQQELIDTVNTAARLGAGAVLTTEKDAVRFPRLDRCDVPVSFLRVDIEILSGHEDFRHCIARVCFWNAPEPVAAPPS
jgi:tetraacyldisaccharide 4'-kinase